MVINMYICPMAKYFCAIQPYDSSEFLEQEFYTNNNSITNFNSEIDPDLYSNSKHSNQRYYNTPTKVSKSEVVLSNTLRMLWEHHVEWTRMTILSIIFGLPDENAVVKRLLRNPKDFESALKPLYGDKIAAKLSELFTNHLVIAAQLVKSAKAGDMKAVSDIRKKWYENADEIAVFLSNINPYWFLADWKAMLYKHLALTESEAVNILKGNYEKGIDIYDEIEKQALGMADVMTEGIVKQFPQHFAK